MRTPLLSRSSPIKKMSRGAPLERTEMEGVLPGEESWLSRGFRMGTRGRVAPLEGAEMERVLPGEECWISTPLSAHLLDG